MSDAASPRPSRLTEIEVANLRAGTKVRLRGVDSHYHDGRIVFSGRTEVWVTMVNDNLNMNWLTFLGVGEDRKGRYREDRCRVFTREAFRQCAEVVWKFAK